MEMNELSGSLDAKGLKIGIVISRFNDLLTNQLLRGALDCIVRHGGAEKDVTVAWVPGSYEIPAGVKKLAESGKVSALVALGAVVQGATTHASLINSQVARALMQISLETGVPIIDGVVAADNLDQAIERCGTKSGNRGWSAAQSAIEMANLFKKI